jgi:hypothetical protein
MELKLSKILGVAGVFKVVSDGSKPAKREKRSVLSELPTSYARRV